VSQRQATKTEENRLKKTTHEESPLRVQ